MAVRWTSVRRIASEAFEALVALPFIAGLHWLGLGGRWPLWVILTVLLCSGTVGLASVQQRLARGHPGGRVVTRLGLHFVLVTVLVYGLGWGPLLAVGFIVISTMHIRTSGAAAWRPSLLWSIAGIVAGQLAVAVGWVYSYLPGSYAQAVGVLGGLAAALTIRAVGLATERREQAEAAVRASEERFRALVQDSHDVVAVADRDGRITYISPVVERITGFRAEEFIGTTHHAWVHPDDMPVAERVLAGAATDPGGQHAAELRTRHRDGGWIWVEVTVRNLLDNPALGGIVANYRDITERRAVQERLAYDASHDSLTGLLNRGAFLRGLEEATDGGGTAVLFIDLDGFKQVNDSLGHEAGDALIVAAAGMLRRSVLGSDLVGRLGGDEFGIVLTRIDNPDHAVVVAKRILAEMDHPVRLAGHDVHVRASIGVAISRPDDHGDLLHRADVAMYAAKRRHTHSFQIYVDGLADPQQDTVALEEDLRFAVRDGQLRLQYQPIVALDGGEVLGVEALVRWAHPTRGLLGPQAFIPLAEETGLIAELGEWVLEQACRQVRAWQLRLRPGRRLSLSVNVSPRQLADDGLVDRVAAILGRTGFDPYDLVLEVTESALVDEAAAVPQLNALSAIGIRIALDDFGTGYSSLRYLTRLPVNILKIDRCFVAELNGTPAASAVAEAVVRLAQILHLDTVAEGVEDPAQANELTLLGCRTGQGYLFARPLDAADIESLIDTTTEDGAVAKR
jgi:diguanylate cyclase (GGDEF)-like protein/PAS domain S-box-containing protein